MKIKSLIATIALTSGLLGLASDREYSHPKRKNRSLPQLDGRACTKGQDGGGRKRQLRTAPMDEARGVARAYDDINE